MIWIAIALGVAVLLFFMAAMSRRAKQRAAVHGLRREFPPIARQRLVGSFPELDPLLDEMTLRMIFDWMLAQAYCRTKSRGFGDLMRWQIENGEAAMSAFIDSLANQAVTKLPRPALQVIDAADGRRLAAVVIENSLTEAGARIAPELERDYV